MIEWCVLADDFTGAMDAGLQFARSGKRTLYGLSNATMECDAIIVSSNSRHMTSKDAAILSSKLAESMKPRCMYFYKKIDSTLRGNVAVELESIMNTLGSDNAVLAPAYPAQERTMKGGILYVDGIPVTQTESSRDPQFPVTDSNVVRLIESTSALSAELIPLKTIRSDPKTLLNAILTASATGARVTICDAETESDLANIALAISQSGQNILASGSAGLATALAKLGDSKEVESNHYHPAENIVIVAGSFTLTTRLQVATIASEYGLTPFTPTLEDYRTPDLAIESALQSLEKTGLWLAYPGHSRKLITPDTVQELEEWIVATTKYLCQHAPNPGLLLTGGETANLVMKAVRPSAIKIVSPVEPGIPGGVTLNSDPDNIPVVTKAGGFGSHKALINGVKWLQSRH
tara:strand:+ start:4347 stop:5564 length:1218 start_codon:yes stop_codon:yes gene_type:complete